MMRFQEKKMHLDKYLITLFLIQDPESVKKLQKVVDNSLGNKVGRSTKLTSNNKLQIDCKILGSKSNT